MSELWKWRFKKLFNKTKLPKPKEPDKISIEPLDYPGYYQIFIQTRFIPFIERVWFDVFDAIPDIVFVVNEDILNFLVHGNHGHWTWEDTNDEENVALTHKILEALKKKKYDTANELILEQFSGHTRAGIENYLNKLDAKKEVSKTSK